MSSSKFSNSDDSLHGQEAQPCSHFQVFSACDGWRLDKLLAGCPPIISREMARRLIKAGTVRLNEKLPSPSSKVRAGDRIAYSLPPLQPAAITAQQGPLRVLYEDEALLVLDKPAGIVVHPGPGQHEGTLVNLLLAHCKNLSGVGGVRRPGIVHRLDKDTSGVMVVAKQDRAHHHLSDQFKAHSIQRSYLALVLGQPAEAQGRVALPLGRHPSQRMKRCVRPDGKQAITHWRVLWRIPPFALLKIHLETGRTHQIRVHMAELGWPVAGDPLYGFYRHRGLELPDELRHQVEQLGRQALHAEELEFIHPLNGQRLEFFSPLPPELRSLWEAVRKFGHTQGDTLGKTG